MNCFTFLFIHISRTSGDKFMDLSINRLQQMQLGEGPGEREQEPRPVIMKVEGHEVPTSGH